jgi:hypothetical protein
MDSLKDAMRKFERMLEKCADKQEHTYEFLYFIKSFIRIRSKEILPSAAIITIIKHEKPKIYSGLSKLADDYVFLEFILQLEMDYEVARKKIVSLKSEG